MNTRQTFNGVRPKRRFHAPAALLMASVIILGACAVAAWIGVIGLYASDAAPAREAVHISLKHDRGASVGGEFTTIQPSDLHQGQIDDGGYK